MVDAVQVGPNAVGPKVRMKVLEAFNRNLDGQMVSGHPDHPMPEHRFVHVSETSAAILERDKVAERYSFLDEARELSELGIDPGTDEDDGPDVGSQGTSQGASGGSQDADTTGTKRGTQSSQKIRESRTAGKPTNSRRSAKRTKDGDTVKGGVQAGGRDTTSTTNHPLTATNGESTQMPSEGAPDPDAAP